MSQQKAVYHTPTVAGFTPPPIYTPPLDPVPYIRLHPDDMAAIEAMIRREVRTVVQEIEDDPTPHNVTVRPNNELLSIDTVMEEQHDAWLKAVGEVTE